jgi:hypothetical protein
MWHYVAFQIFINTLEKPAASVLFYPENSNFHSQWEPRISYTVRKKIYIHTHTLIYGAETFMRTSVMTFLPTIHLFFVIDFIGKDSSDSNNVNMWSSFVYQHILLMKFSDFHEIWYNTNIMPPEVIPLFILLFLTMNSTVTFRRKAGILEAAYIIVP